MEGRRRRISRPCLSARRLIGAPAAAVRRQSGRELGLHETVLQRGMTLYGTRATGTPRRSNMQAAVPSPSDLTAENARLRRENDHLRMERDILKRMACGA